MSNDELQRRYWMGEEQRAMEMLLGAEYVTAGNYYRTRAPANHGRAIYFDANGNEISPGEALRRIYRGA